MSEKKDNLKYAIAYIPLVAFFLYFTEKNISKEYSKHLRYGMILFWMYVLISMVLKVLWMWWIVPMAFTVYLVVSWILAFKAFNWDSVDVEILDNIWDTINDKINKK